MYRAVSLSEKNKLFFVAYERYMPKRILLNLLYARMNNIFKKMNYVKIDLMNSLKPFEFSVLKGVDDFSYSRDAYSFCNYAISNGQDGTYVLDIYQVREEIRQIKESIRSREEIGELIDGL